MVKIVELEKIKAGHFVDKILFVVIGFFDGVHLGHRKIIEASIKKAQKENGKSLVLTFDKPPLNVVKSKLFKKLINSFDEKIGLIEDLGVDFIIKARFDSEFLKLKADEFCKNILVGKFNIKEILVGEGFRFGYRGAGDVDLLKNCLEARKARVNIIPLQKIEGETISSTNVRKYYREGDVDAIKRMLGRYPGASGIVVEGDRRGRLLGFPTANIDIFHNYVTLRDGVYLGKVKVGTLQGNDLPAIINVGDNPTFRGTRKWIEAHMIDFNKNIYGSKISISFFNRLREEIRFTNKEELILQIKKDYQYAKKYFDL